jgi:hypothetical protein
MKMGKQIRPFFLAATLIGALALTLNTGCKIYNFSGSSVPADVKTIRINFIENRAAYINPQLSPTLTDRLKQKIISQTKLSQVNNDNANWDIKGEITDYSVSTAGISSTNGKSETSINRLTVTVKIILTKQIEKKDPEEFSVSRQFDFSATQSIQAAESRLLDEMVRNLTDEIFNRIFSNW